MQIRNELYVLKPALFATKALDLTKFHVKRKIEWFNFQHGRVDFVEFGS